MKLPSNERKIIVIVGPTASGKSDLAVKLAKKLRGEVISADSRQIYKGLDIGSGKITKQEMCGIPHHLLSIANPKKVFTVSEYQKLGKSILEKIWKKNKIPIICGGATLYIDSLIYGLEIPEVKPNLKLRIDLEKKPVAELFSILKKIDSRRAKNIDSKNPRRLVRAIEIAKSLGKVPKIKLNPIKAKVIWIGLSKTREELKMAIQRRLEKRMKRGLIKEIEKLHINGLSWRKLESFGLEYRYVALYLQNKITLEEMKNLIIGESLKYAKRQMTWWKRNKEIHWLDSSRRAENLVLGKL